MMIGLFAAGGVAGLGGIVTSMIARHRIPRPFRSMRNSVSVSLACVTARHETCGDHLACPCACHDDAIHRALTSPSRNTPGRPAAPFVERD